jgi:sorbitol-specific phosphotransferase system component IIA
MTKIDIEKYELRGAGKILDILWGGSYYSMGKLATDRLEKEMVYYFGENWTKELYDFIEEKNTAHEIKELKTLKELKPTKE